MIEQSARLQDNSKAFYRIYARGIEEIGIVFSKANDKDLSQPDSFFRRIPRPFQSEVWPDVVYAIAIATVQQGILATLVPGLLVVDLLTPWLAVGLVLLPPSRSLPLALLAGILLETHSAAPAGLYLTTYWMLGTAVTIGRNAISWTSRAPWLSLMIFSETWMFLAEFVVALLAGHSPSVDPLYYFYQAVRISLSSAFGYLLALRVYPGIVQGSSTDD